MKRIYTILSSVLLGAMLLIGMISTFDMDATYSESERRSLRTTPLMTFSALADACCASCSISPAAWSTARRLLSLEPWPKRENIRCNRGFSRQSGQQRRKACSSMTSGSCWMTAAMSRRSVSG